MTGLENDLACFRIEYVDCGILAEDFFILTPEFLQALSTSCLALTRGHFVANASATTLPVFASTRS
jgi:hypothetical protein